jgi:hypothetical protein
LKLYLVPITELADIGFGSLRIPRDADQRSEVMAITIPNSCRSRFRDDGDHCSDGKPISFWRSSEWRSASSESFS